MAGRSGDNAINDTRFCLKMFLLCSRNFFRVWWGFDAEDGLYGCAGRGALCGCEGQLRGQAAPCGDRAQAFRSKPAARAGGKLRGRAVDGWRVERWARTCCDATAHPSSASTTGCLGDPAGGFRWRDRMAYLGRIRRARQQQDTCRKPCERSAKPQSGLATRTAHCRKRSRQNQRKPEGGCRSCCAAERNQCFVME